MASIQAEITQRLEEIDRVSSQTQFNGVHVLADGIDTLKIQVGAHDGQAIDINLEAINSGTLALDGFSVRTTIEAPTGAHGIQNAAGGDVANASISVELGGETIAGLDGEDVVADGSGNLYVQHNGDWYTAAFAITTEGDADGNNAEAVVTLGAKATNIVDSSDDVVTATTNPLAALDAALAKVDGLRSHLGAIQNRFESTVANLNNTINNLSAARSRIEDADYAVEVSNMTRAQILQQAGTSVLAQANQVPQTVLSLLR